MRKIFWGLLFLLIDIKIGGVSITPAFVGYILIYLGMRDMGAPESFGKARGWIIAGGIWTALFWLPILGDYGWFIGLLTSAVGTAIHLVVTYRIVEAVDELHCPADTGSLHTAWVVLAVCSVIAVLGALVPGIALIAVIVALVASIIYIVLFNRCKKAMEL